MTECTVECSSLLKPVTVKNVMRLDRTEGICSGNGQVRISFLLATHPPILKWDVHVPCELELQVLVPGHGLRGGDSRVS